MLYQRNISHAQNGYIALITVIIVSAVTLAIASTVSLLAIGDAQTSLADYKGEDALQFVEGCMEDALQKAWTSNTYSGGNITRPEGTCIVIVAKSGNNWTITTTSAQSDYNRTVQASITRNATSIALNSWQESLPVPTPTPTLTPMPTNTPTPTFTPTPMPTNTPTPTLTPTPRPTNTPTPTLTPTPRPTNTPTPTLTPTPRPTNTPTPTLTPTPLPTNTPTPIPATPRPTCPPHLPRCVG